MGSTPPSPESGPARIVEIHYLRPPDRRQTFRQELVHDGADVKITFGRNLVFEPPLRILDVVALERGSDALWFTFPGTWHDIGHFYDARGTRTGTYANILTPPVMHDDGRWETIDLFLDLWIDLEGGVHLLDEPQFDHAVSRGWIDFDTARRARQEANRLLHAYERGAWPPPVVQEWDRVRAFEALKG